MVLKSRCVCVCVSQSPVWPQRRIIVPICHRYGQIGGVRYLAGEVLFRPSLVGLEYEGVAGTLVNSVLKCDLDLRKRLFSEVTKTLLHMLS